MARLLHDCFGDFISLISIADAGFFWAA